MNQLFLQKSDSDESNEWNDDVDESNNNTNTQAQPSTSADMVDNVPKKTLPKKKANVDNIEKDITNADIENKKDEYEVDSSDEEVWCGLVCSPES